MAIKTFTTGEVLTAADTNTYLANSGLVYVAAGTLSLSTSYTNITGVFSSTYKQYRVMLNVTSRSVNPSRMDMRYIAGTTATTVNYYQMGIGSDYASNTTNYYQRSNNDAQFFFESSGFASTYVIDIFNANRAASTSHQGSVTVGQQPYSYQIGGFNSPATAFTGFQLVASSGTIVVEYQVFGYREA